MFTLFNSFPRSYFQGGLSQGAEQTPTNILDTPQTSYEGLKNVADTVPDYLAKPNLVATEKQKQIQATVAEIMNTADKAQIASIIKNELIPKNPEEIVSFFDIIKSTMVNEIVGIKNMDIPKEQKTIAIYRTIKKYTEIQVTALRTMVDTENQTVIS